MYSLDEAMQWFLNNNTGSVICVKNGIEKECFSFVGAKNFYQETEQ